MKSRAPFFCSSFLNHVDSDVISFPIPSIIISVLFLNFKYQVKFSLLGYLFLNNEIIIIVKTIITTTTTMYNLSRKGKSKIFWFTRRGEQERSKERGREGGKDEGREAGSTNNMIIINQTENPYFCSDLFNHSPTDQRDQ